VLTNQLSTAQSQNRDLHPYSVPEIAVIQELADKARQKLKNLNFKAKKVIVGNLIEKVVGNQKELIVSGYIPLEYLEQNVVFKTSYWNCGASKRREVDVV
jgi:hypothetical protein